MTRQRNLETEVYELKENKVCVHVLIKVCVRACVCVFACAFVCGLLCRYSNVPLHVTMNVCSLSF